MAAQAATSSSAMRAASAYARAARSRRWQRRQQRAACAASAQRRLTAVGRVAPSVATAAREARVARILAQRQRHAVGRGHADQRRAAHDHVADRGGGILDRAQRAQFERERQPRLVDDRDVAAGVGVQIVR